MINREEYFQMRYKYLQKVQTDKNIYGVQTPMDDPFLSTLYRRARLSFGDSYELSTSNNYPTEVITLVLSEVHVINQLVWL